MDISIKDILLLKLVNENKDAIQLTWMNQRKTIVLILRTSTWRISIDSTGQTLFNYKLNIRDY